MPARDGWDTRVVWNVRRQQWWWNAWRESTATELWGFTDSPEDAWRAMASATENHRGALLRLDSARPES